MREPGRQCLVALALGAAAFALYASTPNERWGVDGIRIHEYAALHRGRGSQHVLQGELGKLAVALLPGLAADVVLRLVCSLAGAVAVASSFLVASRLGARLVPALGGALLLAFSPALWVAATWIEVHALHAGVVALTVLAVHVVARRGPVPTLAVAALGLVLIYGSHASGAVLGPSLVLWVALSLRAAGRPVSPAFTLLVVGPVLLVALLAAMSGAHYLRDGELSLGVAGSAEFVTRWASRGEARGVIVDEWLLPSGTLLPLAAAGAWCVRRYAVRLGLLVWIVPSMAFFAWFGIVERGGYALASLGPAAVLAAFAFDRLRGRIGVAVGVTLVALQAIQGGTVAAEFRSRNQLDERIAQVRAALPDGGTLFVLQRVRNAAPDLTHFVPEVTEERLGIPMRAGIFAGLDDRQVAAQLASAIGAAGDEGPVAIDLSFLIPPEDKPLPDLFTEYTGALLDAVEARWVTRELPHGSWPMLVLESRR